jgi:hypothetical protein
MFSISTSSTSTSIPVWRQAGMWVLSEGVKVEGFPLCPLEKMIKMD